jgi:hypothetical protein
MAAISNPLYGLQIGSVALSAPAGFAAPVLQSGLTKFISQASGEISMSGSSEYVYSDEMNQGSVGLCGSYGVSGISKITSKLQLYYGHTKANTGKTLSITLNAIDWAGVEYIDFNNITASALIAGLSEGPRQKLTTALEKFVAMQKVLGANTDPGKPLAEDNALKKEVKDWVLAVEDFYRNFGTSLVVGVLWGGWGTAKLEFQTTGEENRWKYGGSGNFTYAGTGATVSISAAYGGSKSTIGQKASAKVTASYNGGCVQAKVEKWASDLTALASTGLSEVGNKDVTRSAALAAPIEAPSIPDFVAPKKESKVTDLFKEIKSLDGLKAYAQAAAWQKRKDDGKKESLEDFLKKADAKNNVSGIPDGATVSPITPLDSDDDSSLRNLRAGPPTAGGRDEQPKPQPQYDVSKYEPLGVWIVNWAQLFPWLVSGHDNAVTKSAKALEWIRLKTLCQDCLSLTRLYDRLDGEGCSILVDGKAVDFRGIRDSFSRVATLVGDFLSTVPAVTVVSDKIKYFISQMRPDARSIYAKWDEVPHFRRCELGAGIIYQLAAIGSMQGTNSTVSDLKIQGSRIEIQQETCAFQEPDYSVFSRYGKAWPFIIPDGQILAFVSVGSASTSGILTFNMDSYSYRNTTFSLTKQAIPAELGRCEPNDRERSGDYWLMTSGYDVLGRRVVLGVERALPFYPFNKSAPDLTISATIGNTDIGRFHLYPIPFDAAHGVDDWKGCAMTTGMGTLGNNLKAIKDELSKLNRYTFDSDFWDGVSFKPTEEGKDIFYSVATMKRSYIGVTEGPPNILPGKP